VETSPLTFEDLRTLIAKIDALNHATGNEANPGVNLSKLTLDRSTLEKLLKHATSAARVAGSIAHAGISLLADNIDAIVHELSEVLGNPHLIPMSVPSARASFAPDFTAPIDGVPAFVAPAAPAASRTLSMNTDDTLTQPHVGARLPTHSREQRLAVMTQADERATLRGYLERLLGWDDSPAIEHALHLVDLAATYQAALMLCGDGDLVQVARGLHRHVLGDEHPFVLCDPRRRGTDADAPLENHTTGMAALGAATGGSVCLRSKRLPRDFAKLADVLRARGARVQLIVCGPRPLVRMELVLAPIKIPTLSTRHHELDRIIDECAREAVLALRSSVPFTETDRYWVRTHSATSLPEIEKGVWRTIALRETGNIKRAAALLGIGHTSLGEWFGHRRAKRSVHQRDGPILSR
jgi:hypothetical protein